MQACWWSRREVDEARRPRRSKSADRSTDSRAASWRSPSCPGRPPTRPGRRCCEAACSEVPAPVVVWAGSVRPASCAEDFNQTAPLLSLQCVCRVMFGRLSVDSGDTDWATAPVTVAASNRAVANDLRMTAPSLRTFTEPAKAGFVPRGGTVLCFHWARASAACAMRLPGPRLASIARPSSRRPP